MVCHSEREEISKDDNSRMTVLSVLHLFNMCFVVWNKVKTRRAALRHCCHWIVKIRFCWCAVKLWTFIYVWLSHWLSFLEPLVFRRCSCVCFKSNLWNIDKYMKYSADLWEIAATIILSVSMSCSTTWQVRPAVRHSTSTSAFTVA